MISSNQQYAACLLHSFCHFSHTAVHCFYRLAGRLHDTGVSHHIGIGEIDRAREITKAFVNKEFSQFERTYLHVNFVAMTQYEDGLDVTVAFPPQDLQNTLGKVLADHHIKQLRVAETEKYAHVTF